MRQTHTAMPFLFTLLAFVLASLFGAAVFAQPACEPAGFTDSDGIAAATDVDDDDDGLIEICNLNGLDHVRHNLAGDSYKASADAAANTTGCPTVGGCTGYELTEDLDFTDTGATGYNVVWTVGDPASGSGWPPIGGIFSGTGFAGDFEGNDYEIRNLYIKSTNATRGLFTIINSGAEVRNLGLLNANVSASFSVGILAGANEGTVSGCHSSGDVVSAFGTSGGLLGGNSGMVTDCYAAVNVSSPISALKIGGLIGLNGGSSSVTRCYATGNLDGPGGEVGGLIGILVAGTVTSCYATGSVGGSGDKRGGLVGIIAIGRGTITSSYSTGAVSGADGGGLVGSTSTDVTLSYWDTQTSGKTDSAGGSGAIRKDTDGMKALTTGAFGAKDSDWDFGDNTQYPALKKDGTVVVDQPCPRVGCPPFGGGDGARVNPFQIFTEKHLNSIRDRYLDDHFVLMNDLDFAGSKWGSDTSVTGHVAAGWKPIGHDTNQGMDGFQGKVFSGSFDGGGYVIRNLFIMRTDEDYVGLFGWIGGSVKKLGLTGVRVTGDSHTGGLIGRSEGVVSNCYVRGDDVISQVTFGFTGGLVGSVGGGSVVNCHAAVSVRGRSNTGGFLGAIQSGEVSNCYATGDVTGDARSGNNQYLGGFVGALTGGMVSNCYATGDVTGEGTNRGVFGGSSNAGRPATVDNCYATGSVTGGPGAFVVADYIPITHSYWESSDVATSSDTRDRTSVQLKSLRTDDVDNLFKPWSINDWNFGTTSQYPTLRTYKEDGSGNQVEGDVIAGQPCPRVECDPLVSIAAVGTSPVTEGTGAEFILTRTGSTAAELTVAIMVTGGDFLTDPLAGTEGASMTALVLVLESSDSVTVTIAAGQDSQTFTVNTDNDMLDEADGMITATIAESASTYRLGTDAASVEVAVTDDDPILVRVTGAASAEGAAGAVFTLMRARAEVGALAVKVTVDDGAGDFLTDPLTVTEGTETTELPLVSGSVTVTIAADQGSQTFTVSTVDDTTDEADGTLTATIIAEVDGPYRVDATDAAILRASVEVAVTDDDPILVRVTGAASAEGAAGAVFTLMRARAEAGALAVKVTVDDGAGDFLTDPLTVTEGTETTELPLVSGSVTVTIAADQGSQTFTVSTVDDTTDEADGTLTATIIAEVDGPYRVDATDAAILRASVEVAVTDDDPILVRVTGAASAEGAAGAVFTLMRARAEAGALAVKVTVDDGVGDFLTDPLTVTEGTETTELPLVSGSVTVTIAADQGSQTFTVSTVDDTTDEADGTLTATIIAEVDGPYRVNATDAAILRASVEVDVTDDDLPSITSFKIGENFGVIDENAVPNKTITVTVAEAERTLLVDVTPTVVAVRSDATVTPSGVVTFEDGTAQDFTVMAGDETVIYKVTVNVVAGTPPGVPGGFSAVAGVEQVTLSWTAPTELGSTGTLSRYEYQQTQGTAVSPWTAVVPPTAWTQVVAPLMAGEVYGFEVRAVGSTQLAGGATAKQEATPLAVGALMFSGTIANQTYTKNTAITDLVLPVATGGMGALTYSLTPVPAGLMFDATNRTLSGMPTAVTDTATTHTYTVTDSTPDTELTESMTFTITVNEEGSPTFADTIANQTYTENTVITDLVLPVATGGMGTLTYALTPVPDGLEFDATNRTLSGTPTMPTPTPTTHTYTVTDSTPDTALTASLTFTITVSEEAETTFGIGSQGAAVHVYPNPAGDVLHIEFSGAGEYGIALLTVTGQQVFGGQHAGGGTKKLDVSTLKGGVYFLKIEDSEGVSHTFRIIR